MVRKYPVDRIKWNQCWHRLSNNIHIEQQQHLSGHVGRVTKADTSDNEQAPGNKNQGLGKRLDKQLKNDRQDRGNSARDQTRTKTGSEQPERVLHPQWRPGRRVPILIALFGVVIWILLMDTFRRIFVNVGSLDPESLSRLDHRYWEDWIQLVNVDTQTQYHKGLQKGGQLLHKVDKALSRTDDIGGTTSVEVLLQKASIVNHHYEHVSESWVNFQNAFISYNASWPSSRDRLYRDIDKARDRANRSFTQFWYIVFYYLLPIHPFYQKNQRHHYWTLAHARRSASQWHGTHSAPRCPRPRRRSGMESRHEGFRRWRRHGMAQRDQSQSASGSSLERHRQDQRASRVDGESTAPTTADRESIAVRCYRCGDGVCSRERGGADGIDSADRMVKESSEELSHVTMSRVGGPSQAIGWWDDGSWEDDAKQVGRLAFGDNRDTTRRRPFWRWLLQLQEPGPRSRV